MGLTYHGAPGCVFPATNQKARFRRHLERSTFCPCKAAKWTMEDAVRGQTDGRTARHSDTTAENGAVTNNNGDHNVSHNTTNNVTIINVAPPAVLPSGSPEERAYLLANAEAILKSVVAGFEKPDADIVARFVQETWCSENHTALNNVMAARQDSTDFIRYRAFDGQHRLEKLHGREAPLQLVTVARELLKQLSKDVWSGHNPAQYCVPFYDELHETQQGAETEHEKYGRGVVCQMKVFPFFRTGTDHKWINNRAWNAPPAEDPGLAREAKQAVAATDATKLEKEGKRIAGWRRVNERRRRGWWRRLVKATRGETSHGRSKTTRAAVTRDVAP